VKSNQLISSEHTALPWDNGEIMCKCTEAPPSQSSKSQTQLWVMNYCYIPYKNCISELNVSRFVKCLPALSPKMVTCEKMLPFSWDLFASKKQPFMCLLYSSAVFLFFTCLGSPPKRTIFCWTHFKAIDWSFNPAFPRTALSPVFKNPLQVHQFLIPTYCCLIRIYNICNINIFS